MPKIPSTPSKIWSELRASLWFVPTIIVVGAVALAAILVEVDARIGHAPFSEWPRLFGAGAEGSRGMLVAIATSMVTVAGVVFSITIVALSLASSQYSSRVLRQFVSDRTNQVVLGVFVGIFAYCLVVLRTIRGGEEGIFVPSVAVLTGVLLAFVGIGVLIHFIHHIAYGIQASHIVAGIADETLRTVERLFPDKLAGGEAKDASEPSLHDDSPPSGSRPVPSRRMGYVQRVDAAGLLQVAQDADCVIRMERAIGDFVVAGASIVSVCGHQRPDDEVVERIESLFVIDRQRTVDEDVAYGLRQIVDVALKALSPAVNDTTTAVMCLHYITAIMIRLAGRSFPARERRRDGVLRVIASEPDFAAYAAIAVEEITHAGVANPVIARALLAMLQETAAATSGDERRMILAAQAQRLSERIASHAARDPAGYTALAQVALTIARDLARSSETASTGAASATAGRPAHTIPSAGPCSRPD